MSLLVINNERWEGGQEVLLNVSFRGSKCYEEGGLSEMCHLQKVEKVIKVACLKFS